MPLSTLPSLVHATSHHRTVLTNDYEAGSEVDELSFEDWELQNRTSGVRSFMTLPLVFAGQELGALIVMSQRPNALHAQMQRLVSELGVQVAQSLHLWACQDNLETGEELCSNPPLHPLISPILKFKSRP